MELIKQIEHDIKNAMLAKNADKLRALRGLKKALQDKETEKRGQERNAETKLTPADELNVIQKSLKTRRESLAIYQAANRNDLVTIETDEINVIEAYLPKQLSIDEVTEIVKSAIAETGATVQKDMGKVMAVAIKEIAGQCDNKTVSDIIKQHLSIPA